MTFAAKFIKVPYIKYVSDYRYLVEGNIACCEKFGIDMVSAISDPFREAHGFGRAKQQGTSIWATVTDLISCIVNISVSFSK